jgi:manganese transport protein
MYEKILVALENSAADQSLVPHVTKLALAFRSHLLLLHVADGWVARNFDWLKLSESEEMRGDKEYLDKTARDLVSQGIPVTTRLELGNPPDQILKVAEAERCDLIAMTSHGHRFLGDLFLGSTINEVRHQTSVPVLLVKAHSQPG